VTDLTGFISFEAVFVRSVTATSPDGLAVLSIPAGTSARTAGGSAINQIGIAAVPDPPPPAANATFVSEVYQISPAGAILGLDAGLSFQYDPSALPAGVTENSLKVIAWDSDTSVWSPLAGTTVDPEGNSVTAPLRRFSLVAVSAAVKPPDFVVADLSISPRETEKGNQVEISASVTNRGDVAGAFSATLKVDGKVDTVREIRLDGGESQRVIFPMVKMTPGVYGIDVHGQTGTLTITAPQQVTVLPAPISSVNWGLLMGIIGGIVAAVAMVAMILFMSMRRRSVE
jgi:hypothetical protein